MHIRLGFELIYDCPQPTPMLLMLNVHHSRVGDSWFRIVATDPPFPMHAYRDGFGNWCSRIVAPPGSMRIASTAVVNDTGKPDPVVARRRSTRCRTCPDDTLVFLLGSRYCETDHLSDTAWRCSVIRHQAGRGCRRSATSSTPTSRLTTRMPAPTRTALEAFNERRGVCRDFAHLAVALCRCMNIPARYCTGYLSDIGVPPPYSPMDFAGWFEAYLGWRLAYVRSTQQCAAHRADPDRARSRRRRRADQQHIRAQHTDQLQGLDRRATTVIDGTLTTHGEDPRKVRHDAYWRRAIG